MSHSLCNCAAGRKQGEDSGWTPLSSQNFYRGSSSLEFLEKVGILSQSLPTVHIKRPSLTPQNSFESGSPELLRKVYANSLSSESPFKISATVCAEEMSPRIQQRAAYPWLLFAFEIIEIVLVVASIGFTVANHNITVDISKDNLVLFFIAIRATLLLQFIFGFALILGLFVNGESVTYSVSVWLYGGYFLSIQQTLTIAIICGILKYYATPCYSPEEFVVVIALNSAALLTRFLAIYFARKFLKNFREVADENMHRFGSNTMI